MTPTFNPCAEQARTLDARMRRRLAQSLSYVIEACSSRISADPARVQRFLQRLEQGPVNPQAFGAYYDLVIAIETEAFEDAQGLMDEILRYTDVENGLRVLDFEDPERVLWPQRFCRLMDTDRDSRMTLCPPPSDLSQRGRKAIDAAFQLLDAFHPELADEIRSLTREIVLAVGAEDETSLDFFGASSYMLWGSIVINARNHGDMLDTLQTLVHESAHCVLFGLSVDEALVENGESERYSSPLRDDARPMIGIYHAAYVSARIHQALLRLRDGGNDMVACDMPRMESEMSLYASSFWDCMKTIQDYAKLTPLGKTILQGAVEHMSAFASGLS